MQPDMKGRLSAIARILGPRGLMPNPKLGTLVDDVAGAVCTLKQGRIDFRQGLAALRAWSSPSSINLLRCIALSSAPINTHKMICPKLVHDQRKSLHICAERTGVQW